MKNLSEGIKQEMIERASRLMVQELQEDGAWSRQMNVYGEYLEELRKRLKDEEFFMELESVINKLQARESDYMYWQGVLDGVALLKMLKAI